MLYPEVVHPDTPFETVHESCTEASPAVAETVGDEANGNLKNPEPKLYSADVLVPVASSAMVLHNLKLAEVEYPLGAITGSRTLYELELYS
jgi:hypothetical protein